MQGLGLVLGTALALGPPRCFIWGMSKPNDNPADPFKKALAEATRTMADDPDMTVTYSVDPCGHEQGGRCACRRSAAA